MKFRAAVLAELEAPLVLDELEVPGLRFGQVLVKIRCSGICGAQLNEIGYVDGFDSGTLCPADSDAFYGGCVDSFSYSTSMVDPFPS